jgi:hypothetical protein
MTIYVGSTKKIAVMNDQPDPYYAASQSIWHTPIIRYGNNPKLSQPGTNGMAVRWNMNRGDMRLNNRNGSWSGSVVTKFAPGAAVGDASPAGLIMNSKKYSNSSNYSWADSIGTVNGSADQGTPDYIRLPKTFGTYTGNKLVIDMYVTSSATGTSYNTGVFMEFGILYLIAGTMDKTATWTRVPVDGTKFESVNYGNVGSSVPRYLGSTSKSELSVTLSTSNQYVWVVPFISDNGAVTQASSEYITDIMIGIKLKS